MTALLQCPKCGWYTRALHPPDGRCLDCTVGWITCPTHARLEHAGTDHHRVTVHQILATLHKHRQQHTPPTISAGSRGARAQQ